MIQLPVHFLCIAQRKRTKTCLLTTGRQGKGTFSRYTVEKGFQSDALERQQNQWIFFICGLLI